jgi:hypothetical protein
MRRAILGLLASLVLAGGARAQSPAAAWRTIETAHFRVHFPVPFEKWAERAASSLEDIQDRVTAFVGYRPPGRIEVLVMDPAAEANGMAFPFLDRPVIVLWTSPPESESDLGGYGDWMELLITHEAAHVAHLTRPRNKPNLFERLLPLPLGPVLLNSPRWLIEGYATVVEGALTGGGRPRSSFRAMVLRRFAVAGKLPSYGALSSSSGWLGGSMAYLVGSTYLEWLEEREGSGSLVKLWKRMASRRGGGFETAFRAVFGRSPADLYDRFRAEVTASAIELEKRLKAAGLAEGELWQRLDGGTVSPEVSPDGSRILARRDPKRGDSELAVWTIEETEEETRADEERRRREEEVTKNVNEVAEKIVLPRPRAPKWRLPRANGYSAANPRWMSDGRRILFARRSPDADSALRWDLYVWEVETGHVSRVTRSADVVGADPAPDGSWAAGVRSRYGATQLVRVDLATGETRPLLAGPPDSDPWVVWTHPRVSPDGKTIAAVVHRAGRWRTVLVSEGSAREVALSGLPIGPPAWSPDGTKLYAATDDGGIWNLVEISLRGEASSQITRVLGGAFSPAPSPDGKWVFFLEQTAKGVDLRRLAAPAPEVPALPSQSTVVPILPPPAAAGQALRPAPTAPPRAYNPLRSQVARLASGFTVGPDGSSYQIGVEGSDVVGQLRWQALGAAGNAAGPRGGSLAGAWLGLPAELRLQLFSALERPGGQSLVARPELDEERRGAFGTAAWGRPFAWGSARLEAGGGWTRVEALSSGETFDRALGEAGARLGFRRTRGRGGFALDLDLSGSFGSTRGESWSQAAGGARLAGITRAATLSVLGRYGETWGSPTEFDLFALGGAGSAILPPGLDRNRIESPALPAAVQLGERFEAYRAELAGRDLPLLFYAERLRAWNGGAPKPDWIRLEGFELRLERIVPAEIIGPFSLYAGVARVRSQEPRFDSVRGYGGLIIRP